MKKPSGKPSFVPCLGHISYRMRGHLHQGLEVSYDGSGATEQAVCSNTAVVAHPSAEAAGEVISPNLLLLRNWVLSRAPKGISADDIVQQTCLLALRHIDQFRNESSISTWLCRIALNVIGQRLRSPDCSRMVFENPLKIERLKVVDPRPSPLDTIERKEAYAILHQAIAELPVIYRVVVELRDFHGLSTLEMMKALSLSKAAVQSRYRRARNMLSESLSVTAPGERGYRVLHRSTRHFTPRKSADCLTS